MRMLSMRITIENSNYLANFWKKWKSLEIRILWPSLAWFMQKKRRRKSHAWAPLSQGGYSSKTVSLHLRSEVIFFTPLAICRYSLLTHTFCVYFLYFLHLFYPLITSVFTFFSPFSSCFSQSLFSFYPVSYFSPQIISADLPPGPILQYLLLTLVFN
jgi:hypothetical protein